MNEPPSEIDLVPPTRHQVVLRAILSRMGPSHWLAFALCSCEELCAGPAVADLARELRPAIDRLWAHAFGRRALSGAEIGVLVAMVESMPLGEEEDSPDAFWMRVDAADAVLLALRACGEYSIGPAARAAEIARGRIFTSLWKRATRGPGIIDPGRIEAICREIGADPRILEEEAGQWRRAMALAALDGLNPEAVEAIMARG